MTGEMDDGLVVPNQSEEATEEATAQTLEVTTPEGVNIEEELDTETTTPRIAPDPGQPSSKQMAEH